MLGARKVDSVGGSFTVAYVRAGRLSRSGATRKVNAFIAHEEPDVFAICEIDAGDALSLATRFACSWAYRGGQAVFWNARFEPVEIVDAYLPAPGALSRRRGFVRVNGKLDGSLCALAATQLHNIRKRRVRELRFLRGEMRACARNALLFAQMPPGRIGVDDLEFSGLCPEERPAIWVRGLSLGAIRACALRV